MKGFFNLIFFQVVTPVKVVSFCLFSFYLKANPFTLEHSLTGEETVRLSGHVYEFEVG